jgi:hypothetical protein
MDRVWKNSIQAGGKLLLLLAIADFANDDGMAYPGIDTLAQKTRQSRRTVQRQISELEELGELAVEPGTGRSNTNTYWVLAGLVQNIKQKHIEHCKSLKGDKMTPFTELKKGDTTGIKGDIDDIKRVTSDAKKSIKGDTTGIKGDTAMTPEPLLTVIKDNRQLSNRYEPSEVYKKIIDEFSLELTPENRIIVGLLKKCRPAAEDGTLILKVQRVSDFEYLSSRVEVLLNRKLPGYASGYHTVRFQLAQTLLDVLA